MKLQGKLYLTTVLLSLTWVAAKAQNEYVWAEELDGHDVSVVDLRPYAGTGYAYVGYYPNSIKFNNGKTLSNNSKEKHFLASIDSSYKTQWVSKISGYYGGAHIEDLTIDHEGNHYITGMGQRYVYLHDTAGTKQMSIYLTYNSYRSTAYQNGYLAKYDKHGSPKWAATLRHKWGNSHFEDAQVDDSGSVYVLGSFGSGSKGSANYLTGVSSTLKQVGYADGLVAKYDSLGNLVWHRILGSEKNDNVEFMMSDGKGNLFLQMSFGDTVTIDTVKIAAAGKYLIRMNRKGRVLWAKDPILGDRPVLGSDGNIYSDDTYKGAVTIHNVQLPSAANYSPYMVSYDTLSNFRWIKAFPGKVNSADNSYFGNILYSERTNQLYISGFVRDTIDFGVDRAEPNSLFLIKASAKTGNITFIDTIKTAIRGSTIYLGNNDEVIGDMELRGPGYNGNGKISLDSFSFQASGTYSKTRIMFEYDMGCSGKSLSVSGPTWVCKGDSALLQAKGGHKVKWYLGSTILDSTQKSLKALPKSSTVYTVEFTDTVSGCTIRKMHAVGHYSTPQLQLDSVPAICLNADSVILRARSSIGGGIGVITGRGVFDSIFRPDSAGVGLHTLRYTYTDKHQCVHSTTATARVLALPRVDGGVNKTICIGQTATLIARGASTYNWTWKGGSSTNDTILVSPTDTTVYYLTGLDTHLCRASDSVMISVNRLPNIQASNDTSFCLGDSIVLRASGGLYYYWPATKQNRATIKVSPRVNTSYVVEGSDANGCVKNDTVAISVLSLPNVLVTKDTSLCVGDSIEIGASGAMTYLWTPGNYTQPRITVKPNTTTAYIVTGVGANNCSNTDTVLVSTKALPILSAGPDTFICFGQSINLSASGAAGYTWEPGKMSGQSVTVAPKSTTTYQLTGTGSNGCKASDSVSVAVYHYPTLRVSNDTAVCPGDTALLKVSGAKTHLWLNGSIAQDYIFVNPASKTTYTVVGNSHGCRDTAAVTVDIRVLPAVSAGKDITICLNDAVTLNATGASNYHWLPGNFKGNSYKVSPNKRTDYTVIGTDAFGCRNSDTVIVDLYALPIIGITGDSVICDNDTATLIAGGAKSYDWKGVKGNEIAKVSPHKTTIYTVVGVDTNGCSDSAQFKVRVNQLPLITLSPDREICQGEEVEIEAQGAISYQWNRGLGNGARHTVAPDVSTYYAVTGTDAEGCSNADSLEVKVNALPKVSLNGGEGPYCMDDDNRYVLNGLPGGGTYAGLGVTGQFFIPIDAGVGSNWVTYSYTDSKGCSNSDTLKIEVDDCLAVSDIERDADHIYPNPNNGRFAIRLNAQPANEVLEIRAWSVNGRELDIDYVLLGNNRFEVQLPSYSGLALIQVITQENIRTAEVTIVK